MSEHDDKAGHDNGTSPPLVDFWTRTLGQAAESARETLGGPQGNIDPRRVRQQWFDALGRTTEVYLRSPPFLQALKAHLDSLVRGKLADASRQAAQPPRGGPLADDIQAMRRRLEQVREQLEQLREMTPLLSDPVTSPQSGQSHALPRSVPETIAPEAIKGATPKQIVYEQGNLKLLRYANDRVKFAQPILICFALVNRPYILDLQDDRSVVRRLLDHGFDVYLIDWGIPDHADRHLTLDDYVCSFLKNVVEFVCHVRGTEQLNLLGYCMGGTMSTMFTALHGDRVRNLILMATPIDFGGDEGLLNLWAREDYFDVDRLVDAFGNCPGEFLQWAFQLMKPIQNFAEKQFAFCDNLYDPAFVDNFVALERWANDSIPVAGETFRQYVKALYQQNRLVRGQMSLAGMPVRLESITCPLLLLVAEKDHLVPPRSTLALEKHVSSDDVTSMSIAAGHIGLAVSSKAHRQFWPKVASWIADHSTEI